MADIEDLQKEYRKMVSDLAAALIVNPEFYNYYINESALKQDYNLRAGNVVTSAIDAAIEGVNCALDCEPDLFVPLLKILKSDD
jgi:hypothetical protein